MASLKPSSRYSSFDTRSSTSTQVSDPSSSVELKNPTKPQSSFKRFIGSSTTRRKSPELGCPAQNPSQATAIVRARNEQKLSTMVKKFVETRSKSKARAAGAPLANQGAGLVIPADFIAEDLKKTARKGTNFTALHRKLFSKGTGTGSRSGSGSSGREFSERKALTEVKANTRTLAMVLRSERELMSQNKELEEEIEELKSMLEQKNNEVEKLKDLCLRQRDEIKALKSAVLFPEEMSSQLEGLLEKQGAELKQAKQIIPTLQKQVSCLTGQLQCLAEDLAEVKNADKNSSRGCFDGHVSSPRTPEYDQEAANSLEFSSEESLTPGSPDDMFLKDLNPCLTPYSEKTKSKEFEEICNDSLCGERLSENSFESYTGGIDSNVKKLSKSSDTYQSRQARTARVPLRSKENWLELPHRPI